MWNNLPFDVLSSIFSFLSPDSLARARSTCKNWHTCGTSITKYKPHETTPWFLALPIRNYQKSCCYAHNPITKKWHEISLDFFPFQTSLKPIGPIGSLVLLKVANSTALQLVLCNPFTRQFKYLPKLNISRTNPACGIVTILEPNDVWCFPCFRIYVAGGMSEAKHGGATYEPTVEIYESCIDTWKIVGSMPVEFSVRLTVWTPNENVCIEGRRTTTLYWITSARAYSVIGFDVGNNCWREFSVPLADRLEFATLVRWNGGLGLIGGTCGGNVCVWEMSEGDKWCLVDEMPSELGVRLLCGKRNWEGAKCVSDDDAICLYRELGYGMVICRKIGNMGRWEWVWIDGCGYIKGKKVLNCPIRGILVHPTLASSSIFF